MVPHLLDKDSLILLGHMYSYNYGSLFRLERELQYRIKPDLTLVDGSRLEQLWRFSHSTVTKSK